MIPKKSPMKTSWEVSAKPYGDLVGQDGSYYHRELILPNLLAEMALEEKSAILEFGCGQGVFARQLTQKHTYFGLDASPSLIQMAKKMDKNGAYFKVQDLTQKFRLTKTNFDHIVIILALQNMKDMLAVLANARSHIHRKGKFWMVLNHPAFRIPKSTSWITEPKTQARRVDRYMTPQTIPIDMTPGSDKNKKTTWSFHHPISDYAHALKATGWRIDDLFEWVSPKTSVGKNAERENHARIEIPMFLALCASPR